MDFKRRTNDLAGCALRLRMFLLSMPGRVQFNLLGHFLKPRSPLMATFISTIKFTQQGIAGIHETTQRAAALKAAAKKMRAKITNIFWTLGPFDGVLIFEAPDDE